MAPNPDDWPVLLGKVGELFKKDYDWSADVSAIKPGYYTIFSSPALVAAVTPFLDVETAGAAPTSH